MTRFVVGGPPEMAVEEPCAEIFSGIVTTHSTLRSD